MSKIPRDPPTQGFGGLAVQSAEASAKAEGGVSGPRKKKELDSRFRGNERSVIE